MGFSTFSVASDSGTLRINEKHFSSRKSRSRATNCLHIGSSAIYWDTAKSRKRPLKRFEFVELTLVDGSHGDTMNKQVDNSNNGVQKRWVVHDKNARGLIANKELVIIPAPSKPDFCNQPKYTYCQPLKELGWSWKISKRGIVIIVK